MAASRYSLSLQTLVIVVVLAVAMWLGYYWIDREEVVYSNYSKEELGKFLDQGYQFIQANELDSALTIYSMVANSCYGNNNPDYVRLRAQAYNNIGYALLYDKHDYSGAYAFFLKALADAKESAYEELYPYIYLNLGNIQLNGKPEEALRLYKDAFNSAMSSNSVAVVNISFVNMINVAMDLHKLDDVSNEMTRYASFEIPDSVPLKHFSGLIHSGAEAMLDSDYSKASDIFDKASKDIDSGLTPTHYEVQAYGNRAEAILAMGDTIGALKVMRDMETATLRAATPEARCNLYAIISNIYDKLGRSDSADIYHLRHLELADSIFGYKDGFHLANIETQGKLDEMGEHYRKLTRRHSRSRLLLGLGTSLLCIILIFSLITYYQKRKATELLKSLYVRHQHILELQKASDTRLTADSTDDVSTNESIKDNDGDGVSPQEPKVSERVKYQTSALTEEDKQKCAKLLTEVAVNTDCLFRMGFSVEQLAEEVGMKEKEVSQVINEMWNMNFNAWVNSYRCREAAARLADPAYDHLTIEGIGEGLGFRNRSHFASVFKQSVGMTPAEYRRTSRLVG